MMAVIGVDPGAGGACVLLDGRRAVDWLVWWSRSATKTRPRRTVAWRAGNGEEHVDRLSETVARWRDLLRVPYPCGYHLAVEGLFVVGAKGNGSSMLSCAESAGMLRGVLEQRCVGEVHRPKAEVWRRDVLGLRGRVRADVCEDVARQRSRAMVEWVHDWPANKGAQGALAEAACIAQWSQAQRRMEAA